MKTMIPSKMLAASLHCAAKLDKRYYLKGVFLELRKGECRLVSSDGSTASVLRYQCQEDKNTNLIIPREIVELALKMKRNVCELEVGTAWSLCGIQFTPIDGVFPDYRRIIPTSYSNEAAQFDPEYVQSMAKIGKTLNLKSCPIIRHNGLRGALVQFYSYDDFVGVIMPLNAFTEKCPDLGIPTWGGNRDTGSEFV